MADQPIRNSESGDAFLDAIEAICRQKPEGRQGMALATAQKFEKLNVGTQDELFAQIRVAVHLRTQGKELFSGSESCDPRPVPQPAVKKRRAGP
jgi:hypothetical protein